MGKRTIILAIHLLLAFESQWLSIHKHDRHLLETKKRQNTTYKRSVNKHDSKQKGSVCYDLQHSRIIIINKIQNNIQALILMQLIVIPNFVHNQLRTNSWYSIRAVTVLLLMKLADNRASRRLYGSYKVTSYNRLDASSSFQAFPC